MHRAGSQALQFLPPAPATFSTVLPVLPRDTSEFDLLVALATSKRRSKAKFGRSRLGLGGKENLPQLKGRPQPQGQSNQKQTAGEAALEPKSTIDSKLSHITTNCLLSWSDHF